MVSVKKADSIFEERLAELTEEFYRSLPVRLREIATVTADAESGAVSAMEELRLTLHRLAGSAATFGLPKLSSSARSVEECIDRDLARLPPALSDESRAGLAALASVAME